MDKDGNNLGVEDPNCPNHALSAARYFLMEMVQAKLIPKLPTKEDLFNRDFNAMLERKKKTFRKTRFLK
jgi:hypothetical protein